MFGFSGLGHLFHRHPRMPPQPQPAYVANQSAPEVWQAHHARVTGLPQRHIGTYQPGIFHSPPAHISQTSPLRFIRSTLDYTNVPLGPIVQQAFGRNTHQVLTEQGYPSGLLLIVEQARNGRGFAADVERLARLSEKGIPVPEILSYGHCGAHHALLMPENAPLCAAMPARARPRW